MYANDNSGPLIPSYIYTTPDNYVHINDLTLRNVQPIDESHGFISPFGLLHLSLSHDRFPCLLGAFLGYGRSHPKGGLDTNGT